MKTKRFYFGALKIKSTCVTLSVLKPSGGLPADLKRLKKKTGIALINFEDAKVDLCKLQLWIHLSSAII